MKIKPFTYFLCALALILIALSPWLIQSYYSEEPETVPYKGILTLWNITSWRTGGSSLNAFLKKRVADFESRNAYCFIDLVDMSAEEAQEALQKGELPDIISYPLGFDPSIELCSLPHKDTLFPQIDDDAYPYMCGGYCMLINAEMLDEQGLFPPDGWGVRPDELISLSTMGVCFDSETGYSSLPAIALHKYPGREGPENNTWGQPPEPDAALELSVTSYSGGLNYFTSEQSGILIASQRQLFEITSLYQDGSAPSFLPYAISGYTDMVQLISVASSEDDKKQKACSDFAEYLLSEQIQKKLEALGVFPVIPGLDIYGDSEVLNSMYGLLSENAALGMPEDRQKLSDLSMQMLGGNGLALSELRALLGVY